MLGGGGESFFFMTTGVLLSKTHWVNVGELEEEEDIMKESFK